MAEHKGGSDAALFLVLFAVAVLGIGGSLQYPLAFLRVGGFGVACWYLLRGRGDTVQVSLYALLVGGFVLLSLGHAFSSTYFWVSFQHALNIALAAVLLAWAVLLFRRDPGKTWNKVYLTVCTLALAEVGIALFQRISGGDVRPRGTFDNANYLSEFLAAASILCCARALWNGKAGRLRIAAGSTGVLFFAASMVLPSSRGVLLASVFSFAVLFMVRFGIRKGGAILAWIGLPSLALLGFRVAGRFFGPDPHNYSRWIMWKSALQTFIEHPFGVGLGGFKYYWFATQSPVAGTFRRYGKIAATAHNEYLEVLSGLGVIGFLLFIAVLAYPLLLAIRNRSMIPEENRQMAGASASCLILSGGHALFNANFHVFGIFFLDAVMLAALVSCVPRDSSPTFNAPYWLRRVGIGLCAALIAAGISTGIGAFAHDRGGSLLRAGDLAGAERMFRIASVADPFRSNYPDALSAVHYRYHQEEITTGDYNRSAPESLFETIRWESRASSRNPRELHYALRLSSLFLELYSVRGVPFDAELALRFADNALRINPYGVEALWIRADIYVALGKREAAVRDLENAVSVEPNFCRGYARLANLAGKSGHEIASRWSAREQECRRRAANFPLEEAGAWLVESPEGR